MALLTYSMRTYANMSPPLTTIQDKKFDYDETNKIIENVSSFPFFCCINTAELTECQTGGKPNSRKPRLSV